MTDSGRINDGQAIIATQQHPAIIKTYCRIFIIYITHHDPGEEIVIKGIILCLPARYTLLCRYPQISIFGFHHRLHHIVDKSLRSIQNTEISILHAHQSCTRHREPQSSLPINQHIMYLGASLIDTKPLSISSKPSRIYTEETTRSTAPKHTFPVDGKTSYFIKSYTISKECPHLISFTTRDSYTQAFAKGTYPHTSPIIRFQTEHFLVLEIQSWNTINTLSSGTNPHSSLWHFHHTIYIGIEMALYQHLRHVGTIMVQASITSTHHYRTITLFLYHPHHIR